jgi:hypothetical protein
MGGPVPRSLGARGRGGRPELRADVCHADPEGQGWTERRLVPLAPRTLERLEEIAAKVREHGGVSVEPMQLAALLLEKTTEDLSEAEADRLVRPKRSAGR